MFRGRRFRRGRACRLVIVWFVVARMAFVARWYRLLLLMVGIIRIGPLMTTIWSIIVVPLVSLPRKVLCGRVKVSRMSLRLVRVAVVLRLVQVRLLRYG